MRGHSASRTLPTICDHRCSVAYVSCQAASGNSGHSSCAARAIVAFINPPRLPMIHRLVRRVAAKSHQHHDGLAIGNRRGILAHPNYAVTLARKTIDLVLMFLLRIAANEYIRRGILFVNFAGGSHRVPLLEDYTAAITRSTA